MLPSQDTPDTCVRTGYGRSRDNSRAEGDWWVEKQQDARQNKTSTKKGRKTLTVNITLKKVRWGYDHAHPLRTVGLAVGKREAVDLDRGSLLVLSQFSFTLPLCCPSIAGGKVSRRDSTGRCSIVGTCTDGRGRARRQREIAEGCCGGTATGMVVTGGRR